MNRDRFIVREQRVKKGLYNLLIRRAVASIILLNGVVHVAAIPDITWGSAHSMMGIAATGLADILIGLINLIHIDSGHDTPRQVILPLFTNSVYLAFITIAAIGTGEPGVFFSSVLALVVWGATVRSLFIGHRRIEYISACN